MDATRFRASPMASSDQAALRRTHALESVRASERADTLSTSPSAPSAYAAAPRMFSLCVAEEHADRRCGRGLPQAIERADRAQPHGAALVLQYGHHVHRRVGMATACDGMERPRSRRGIALLEGLEESGIGEVALEADYGVGGLLSHPCVLVAEGAAEVGERVRLLDASEGKGRPAAHPRRLVRKGAEQLLLRALDAGLAKRQRGAAAGVLRRVAGQKADKRPGGVTD